MSKETDGIIAFARAYDSSVVVTATTNGTHAPGSYHKRKGTNGLGLAVDFAFAGSNQTGRMLALAKEFVSVAGQLAELFFDPLGYSIKNGQRISYLPGDHFDHVHVAVPLGTFLAATPGPAPTPQPLPQEDDLPRYADQYRWPNGDQVQVFLDGHVECYGQTPDFGDITRLRDDAKVGFREARSVAPVDPATSSRGYIIFSQDRKWFTFDANTLKQFGK